VKEKSMSTNPVKMTTRTLTQSEILDLWNICRTAERAYTREATDGIPQFKEAMAKHAEKCATWAALFLALPSVTVETLEVIKTDK
jgi:hypothetical protein